jgi:hypothetical protein
MKRERLDTILGYPTPWIKARVSGVRFRETETSWKVSAKVDGFFADAEVLKRFAGDEVAAKSYLIGVMFQRGCELQHRKSIAWRRCIELSRCERASIKCVCGGHTDSWPYYGRCFRHLPEFLNEE